MDLGDATVTSEVLKETVEESATLIVAEIETKQSAGTLDLSDTDNSTVAAIVQVKESQEQIVDAGLDDTLVANITTIASTAAQAMNLSSNKL